MNKIKTKDVVQGTIKTIDRSAIAGQRMKERYVATKQKAEQSAYSQDSSAEQYAADRAENTVSDTLHTGTYHFDKHGQRAVYTTKDNIQRFRQKRAEKQIINLKEMGNINPIDKVRIKTSPVQPTTQAVQATATNAKKTVERVRYTTAVMAKNAKTVAKATASTVKSIIAATQSLITALLAGSWIAGTMIIVVCIFSLFITSVFGVFFSGEESKTGMTMKMAVEQIHSQYLETIEQIKTDNPHDFVELHGEISPWKDVIAIYAVLSYTDPDNPQEIATMDEEKAEMLSEIFWQMNEITAETTTDTRIEPVETDDGYGNIVITEKVVTETYLHISTRCKNALEFASEKGFSREQQLYLTELLKPENEGLWVAVIS